MDRASSRKWPGHQCALITLVPSVASVQAVNRGSGMMGTGVRRQRKRLPKPWPTLTAVEGSHSLDYRAG